MNTILADIQKDMDDFFAEMDKAIGRVPEKKVKKVEKKAWLSHIFFVYYGMRNKEKIMKTIKFRKLEDPTKTVEAIVPTKEFG